MIAPAVLRYLESLPLPQVFSHAIHGGSASEEYLRRVAREDTNPDRRELAAAMVRTLDERRKGTVH